MVIQGVSPLYSNLFSYSVLYSYLYSNSVSFWHTPYAVLVHPPFPFGRPPIPFGYPHPSTNHAKKNPLYYLRLKIKQICLQVVNVLLQYFYSLLNCMKESPMRKDIPQQVTIRVEVSHAIHRKIVEMAAKQGVSYSALIKNMIRENVITA